MKRSFVALCTTYVLLLACGDDPTGLAGAPGVLVLAKHPGGNGAEIWTMRPDGSDARQLTSDNRIDADADWSPDGQRIVFTKVNDTATTVPFNALQFEVHVMDADGSDVQRLTTRSDGSDRSPRWSPDGTQIVFSRNGANGPEGIFVMNADGSNARALYADSALWPDWSPDGTKILFVTSEFDLYVMNADGTGVTPLGGDAACPGHFREPRWSPDGSRIAYTCDNVGYSIHTMRPDGTDIVTVRPRVVGTGGIGAPVWSPDGRFIAFWHVDGTNDVFIVRSTGGGEVRITNDSRLDIVTDWQR